jgi:hypothetical protein
VRTLEGPANAGFNRATWDLSAGQGRMAEPGEYKVTMEVGKFVQVQRVRVLAH